MYLWINKSKSNWHFFFLKKWDETNFEEETEGTEDLEIEDWGNDDDNEWEEDIDLKLAEANYKRLLNLELVWKKMLI
ncbi:19822_t:CDS:2 [Funneliformis geosporum]|uniref:19822_t:CDS:1 n=1 Tax=Funneliformis geosporum TaxID=1117311 RepID=A0A9W4T1H6_9GLOM|nr:19822_t:CDS:2 [Funneliformis geosporum]